MSGFFVINLFVAACLGHTPLDMDQSLCHLGVATFLRYFLSPLGRHHLVQQQFSVLSTLFISCTLPKEEWMNGVSVVSVQALPELPEDVLCFHADAVQRASLAQHHSPYYDKLAAGCHQKGSLQGIVSHSHWTCTGNLSSNSKGPASRLYSMMALLKY